MATVVLVAPYGCGAPPVRTSGEWLISNNIGKALQQVLDVGCLAGCLLVSMRVQGVGWLPGLVVGNMRIAHLLNRSSAGAVSLFSLAVTAAMLWSARVAPGASSWGTYMAATSGPGQLRHSCCKPRRRDAVSVVTTVNGHSGKAWCWLSEVCGMSVADDWQGCLADHSSLCRESLGMTGHRVAAACWLTGVHL